MIDEQAAADLRLAADFAASVGLDAQGATVTIPAGTLDLDTGPVELPEPLVAVFNRPLCGAVLTLHRIGGTRVMSALVDGFADHGHDGDTAAVLRLAHAALRTYDLDRTPCAEPPLVLERATAMLLPRAPRGTMARRPDDEDPNALLLTYGPMRVSAHDQGFAVWERFAWDDAGSQTAVIFEEAGHWGPAGMAALMVETFEYTDTLRNGPAALFTTPRPPTCQATTAGAPGESPGRARRPGATRTERHPHATNQARGAMITTHIESEQYKVALHIVGAPEIPAPDGETLDVTLVTLTFNGRELTTIRFATSDGDLYVAPADVDDPATWPTWLGDLIERYRPAARPE